MVNRRHKSQDSPRPKRRRAEIDLAIREIARQCVFVIRGCLREEEWQDARSEFERIIRDELELLGLSLIE